MTHFLKQAFAPKKRGGDIAQKGTETSLIEKFMYPKLGPGQLWEYVAEDVQAQGRLRQRPAGAWRSCTRTVFASRPRRPCNAETGERRTIEADYFFSTMPIKELMRASMRPFRPMSWKSAKD